METSKSQSLAQRLLDRTVGCGDIAEEVAAQTIEIDRLRVDATRYLWLKEDADRCAQVVSDAYDTWDTDVHWDEHFDAAVTDAMRLVPETEVSQVPK